MKNEDLTIFEYRLGKEIKYTDIVKNERALGRSEKVSFFAENIGYIDGYIYRPQNREEKALPAVFNFHGAEWSLAIANRMLNTVRGSLIRPDRQ